MNFTVKMIDFRPKYTTKSNLTKIIKNDAQTKRLYSYLSYGNTWKLSSKLLHYHSITKQIAARTLPSTVDKLPTVVCFPTVA